MRKASFTSVLSLLVLALILYGGGVSAHMGPGMMWGGGYGGWYCPYCGQPVAPGPGMMGPGMTGPGMMGPWMMGPGMMGPGMMGPGMMGRRYQELQKPLEEKDVKAIAESYIQSTGNPNLKVGKIKEKENSFEVEIVTKENSLVDKILVDKFTGWMRSIY